MRCRRIKSIRVPVCRSTMSRKGTLCCAASRHSSNTTPRPTFTSRGRPTTSTARTQASQSRSRPCRRFERRTPPGSKGGPWASSPARTSRWVGSPLLGGWGVQYAADSAESGGGNILRRRVRWAGLSIESIYPDQSDHGVFLADERRAAGPIRLPVAERTRPGLGGLSQPPEDAGAQPRHGTQLHRENNGGVLRARVKRSSAGAPAGTRVYILRSR